MSLIRFVSEPEHFVARERLLHQMACVELKLAAAKTGKQLHLTEPEIDNIGHDFIASIGFYQIFIQNKATLDTSKVKKWSVHKRFLEVSFQDRDLAPNFSGLTVGGMSGAFGALLLHEISRSSAENQDLSIDYYYFDILYANAVRTGLWRCRDFSQEEAESL